MKHVLQSNVVTKHTSLLQFILDDLGLHNPLGMKFVLSTRGVYPVTLFARATPLNGILQTTPIVRALGFLHGSPDHFETAVVAARRVSWRLEREGLTHGAKLHPARRLQTAD